MFDSSLFDVDRIATTLYDPAGHGGVSLPGFLAPSFLETLLGALRQHAGLLRPAPREYLNALQEFDYFQLGEKDEDAIDGAFEPVFQLRHAYAGLTRILAAQARFCTAGWPNSIAVHRYPEGSVGITPHRDQSKYVNLISIFVLAGEAPFCISSDRTKTQVEELSAPPGGLILLRAPRDRHDPEEKRVRPMHFVGRVTRERYSLTFREQI